MVKILVILNQHAATKLVGIDESDAVLDSAGVGSVILYWIVSGDVRLEVPVSITHSLSQVCSKAGITHIGTVVNQNVTLIKIIEIARSGKCIVHVKYVLIIYVHKMN